MEDPVSAEKLLFVCSQNKLRSLTAEKMLAGMPGYKIERLVHKGRADSPNHILLSEAHGYKGLTEH